MISESEPEMGGVGCVGFMQDIIAQLELGDQMKFEGLKLAVGAQLRIYLPPWLLLD